MTHTLKTFFGFPKILCFLCSCVLAYALFRTGAFDVLDRHLNGHGFVSVFLGGLLFSFGFTSPFAIGIFLDVAHTVDPFLGAVIGGTGAVLSDIGIFSFVRCSFRDEFDRLQRTGPLRRVRRFFFHDRFPATLRHYLLWSFAGVIIASPLPDELGVTLLGGATNIDARKFAVLCFVFNCLGIFVILAGARALG